jgi:putative membrane protein
MTRFTLTAAERNAVTAAVKAAEATTDGEIVTIVTRSSDAYHDVALHYALAAMLAVTAAGAIRPDWLTPFDHGWEHEPSLSTMLFALLIAQTIAFLFARLLLAWRPLRLALTPRATRSRRVRRRALACFRVGTERRTAGHEGVLLYLSLDERRAEIIADAAVHGHVAPESWGEVMAALVDAIRADRTAAGLVAAVSAIGAILAGVLPKTTNNRNELPDRVIEL